jgi:hypothetical protein
MKCKIWYLISRTVSDDDAHCGDIDDRSVRAFAVKPAPSARRHAALGLDCSARPSKSGDRTANELTRCSGNQRTRLSDNVRQVECWFSHLIASALFPRSRVMRNAPPRSAEPSAYRFGFHSRASHCASAICAGVILAATALRPLSMVLMVWSHHYRWHHSHRNSR